MKKSGFTLTELLIVIAIIGILAAVLVPNLLNSRKTAQRRAEQSYGQNVYKAVNAYIAQFPSQGNLSQSCLSSFALGSYGAGTAPSTLTSCNMVFTASNQSVVVTYAGNGGSGTVGN